MNRLQEKRLALELTQPQVSARLKEVEPRADVGMVSRYEKGVCLPTGPQLSVLEELYGAARTELYDAEDLDLLGTLRSTETCAGCRWRGRHQKCSCCRRNRNMRDAWEEAST